MTLDELTTRMFNLRADLSATNLAIDALCASMPTEAHSALFEAWLKLRAAHEAALRAAGRDPQTLHATLGANQRMEERLRHAPRALAQL